MRMLRHTLDEARRRRRAICRARGGEVVTLLRTAHRACARAARQDHRRHGAIEARPAASAHARTAGGTVAAPHAAVEAAELTAGTAEPGLAHALAAEALATRRASPRACGPIATLT